MPEDILRNFGICFGGSRMGSSIFDIFFGRERHEGPNRGSDIIYDLTIEFEDAASEKKVELEVPRTETCDICNGSGAKPGTFPKTCPTCHGSRQASTTQNTPFGRFMTTSTCGKCQGKGKVIDVPCTNCHGSGTIQRKRKLEVKIPPGVETGSRLRIPGEGDVGEKDGPAGDLYIKIYVKPHNIFNRQESDITMETTVSFVQVALGDEIVIPTLDGKASMKIPSGTPNGHIFKLRGKGFPSRHVSGRGDQLVKIKVDIPTKLSERQKQILLEFAEISGENAI